MTIIQTIDFPWARARPCEGRGSSRARACREHTRTVVTVEHDDGTEEDIRLCGSCIKELKGEESP